MAEIQVINKILVAFDFDDTIIDDNSDLYILKLAPKLPQEIKDLYDGDSWTRYMAAIFKYLHKTGVTEEAQGSCMEEIQFTDGMIELLQYLNQDRFQVIIISDSNSFFINKILSHAKLSPIVHTVYTNPAWFDKDGCLQIEYYHHQDWCNLSTKNLCKGDILTTHIKSQLREGISLSHVVYVGDGTNDLCPVLKLNSNDLACPRRDYRLWKKLKPGSKSEKEVKALICPWSNARELIQYIKTIE